MTKSPSSPLLREQADALTLSMEIRRAAEHALRAGQQGAAVESNFEDLMRPVLEDTARRLGVEIDLSSQVAIIGAGPGGGIGKADLVFSNVLLELKAPGRFAPAPGLKFAVPAVDGKNIAEPTLPESAAPGNREALIELARYLIGKSQEQHGTQWRVHLDDYAGVGLDGYHIFFVRYLAAVDRFDVSPATEVSETAFHSVHRLLVLIRSARKRALSADSLAADFAIVEASRAKTVNPRAQDMVRHFYTKVVDALEQHGQRGAAVRARYGEWRKLFREVVSFEEKEARSKFGDLQKLYGLAGRADAFQPAAFFFALSTYYGLLVKMLAAEQLVNYCCTTLTTTLEALSSFEPDQLREYLYDMEREGGSFAQFQIRNFLEGELFDWYVEPDVWDDKLGAAVHGIISKLSEYEIATFELRPEETRDLLKDLYQHLFPQKVRHALGEYYTPDWLADFVLEEVGAFSGYAGDPHQRLLDPACGSGTFLVEAIKLARQWLEAHPLNLDEARALITRNIVGFDLNPLAVLTARANYILALGDLIRGTEGLLAAETPITIPVYLTDSIMVPARPRQSGFEQSGDAYQVDLEALRELRPTAPHRDHVLYIPDAVVDGGQLNALIQLMREGLSKGWTGTRFRSEADTRLNLSELYRQQSGTAEEPTAEIGKAQTLLVGLFEDMKRLEKAGLDGLWGRFLLNRFAPVLNVKAHGRFDLIIGNPPWINWESLPDDYRDDQQPLWKDYHLFKLSGSSVKGTSVRHGAGKKDLSMLMTYIAVDKLLKDGGHLAFVITQTVFKTEAGEGFRRFVIPDTATYFAPQCVHDFSAFQPFAGATNRTAVFVVKKGEQVTYPVDYYLWRATEPVYTSDTLPEVKRKTERCQLAAEPVNKAQNGYQNDRWLTAKPKAIRALRKFTGTHAKPIYQAYAGSYTGGANGVYWFSIDASAGKKQVFVTNYLKGAKRKVKQYTGYKIETELLYPLLRGRDVQRWKATSSMSILMAQDPQTRMGYREDYLRDIAPLTYHWLMQFRKELLERAAFKKFFGDSDAAEFWTMYNISDHTFAPYKVVWREMASNFTAAVTAEVEGKVHIPDHKLMLVPCKTENEAHYLCAVLNSSPVGLSVLATTIQIQFDPHILTRLAIPQFDPKDETHKTLARASKAAHKAVAKEQQDKVHEIEEQVDGLVSQLWNLSDDELEDIKGSLRDLGGTIGYEDDIENAEED